MDNTQTLYRLAADGLLLLHAAFVGFVIAGFVLIVAGGFCGWRWIRNPWFRGAHLAAIVFVVVQAWLGRLCPLTTWEMALREKAGDAVYQGAFVAHWLEGVLYYDAPAWVFTVAYTVFGGVVALSWFLLPPRRRP
jgi:Protein of Unknown function (DUF2784)